MPCIASVIDLIRMYRRTCMGDMSFLDCQNSVVSSESEIVPWRTCALH